jgi:hypothetical protein
MKMNNFYGLPRILTSPIRSGMMKSITIIRHRQGTLTRTTLTDTDRFNQKDHDYYKGAYILVWCQPNVVTPREIQSFDPQSSTIQFEDLGSSAIYDNREQYYSIINHISNLDRKGEYVYDAEEGRLYIWPNSPEPQSAVFSIGKRDWAFRLFGSNVVIEGFEVRSFYGEPRKYHTGGAVILKDSFSENVVIRNNEIHEIRSMVGAGAINLVNAKKILIENNTIWVHPRRHLCHIRIAYASFAHGFSSFCSWL